MTYLSKELLREQGKTKAIETTYDTPFALTIRVMFGRSTKCFLVTFLRNPRK